MLTDFFSGSLGSNILLALKYLLIAAPFFLPVILLIGLFNAWISYKRELFLSTQGSVLLEIKLPKDVFKSPAAMETVLGGLLQAGGEQTWVDRIWYAKVRQWSSLEIVSLGGKIHLYIWIRPNIKTAIEAQFYAQYPGVEIQEVKDYALPFSYDPDKNALWGCEWKLTKADPYPIKTYVDYGLDKDPKEEYKIDPMNPMLEFLGTLTEGHNIFVQIIVRAHRKRRWQEVFSEQDDSWKDQSKKEIEDLIKKFRPEDKEKQSRQATEGERDTIAALERSASKPPYDVGIRTIYFADKDKFNGSNIGGMLGTFRQYGAGALNGFAPTGWLTMFNYPWQDRSGKTKERYKKMILEQYKMRSFFFSLYRGKNFFSKPFVLNSEELATIFHLPGAVATTPTLQRVPSKKSEAPANLPI